MLVAPIPRVRGPSGSRSCLSDLTNGFHGGTAAMHSTWDGLDTTQKLQQAVIDILCVALFLFKLLDAIQGIDCHL